jgi:hypothetical protein
VLRVERAIGLPDREVEVEQLAHAVADGAVPALVLGFEPAVEGANGRVVAGGHTGDVPEQEGRDRDRDLAAKVLL